MSIAKIPKQEYTAEFKELAVKRVNSGQAVGAVAKELGLVEQTLRNWVKACDAGKLTVMAPGATHGDEIPVGWSKRSAPIKPPHGPAQAWPILPLPVYFTLMLWVPGK